MLIKDQTKLPPKNEAQQLEKAYNLGDPTLKKNGILFRNVVETNNETTKQISAMNKARNVLGKFLSKSMGKNNESWLVTTLRHIVATTVTPFNKSSVKFELNKRAAEENTRLLEQHQFDYRKLMESNNNTILSPGVEFRDIPSLQKIWKHHKDWKKIKEILTKGAKYPCHSTPSEEERLSDIEAMIERGNHKSASKDKESRTALAKNYEKEVNRGWMIPITVEALRDLKHARVIPIGVSPQWTVNAKGERVIKRRITHDCSFSPPSGHSINNDTDLEILDPCIYGNCLRRLCHAIHSLRLRYPSKRILISKVDLEAAYRRVHVTPEKVITLISIWNGIAYLLTRLPFGASAGPSKYCTISEAIFDLLYDLLLDETWNPQTFQDPDWHHFLAKIPTEQKNDPIAVARELIVKIPENNCYCDGYVDNGVAVAVDMENNKEKLVHAGPLVLKAVTRPVDGIHDQNRPPALAMIKMAAEFTPDESKQVLGWIIHTRKLRIFLPMEKFLHWKMDIQDLLKKGFVKTKELESVIGRLNHAGHILPAGRYFLNRLRYRLNKCKEYGRQKLAKWDIDDLNLWIDLLEYCAQEGVDLNHMNYTKPTNVGCTDACEHGLGGFTADGLARRFQLPEDLKGIFTINLLEFIAAVINIWMTIIHKGKGRKILNFTDSSSALGWLYKSSFDPTKEILHNSVTRHLARLQINSHSSLYSQHIKGSHNIIADMLSRDFHLSDWQITNTAILLFPEQVPSKLTITPLSNKIISWLYSLRDSLPAWKVSRQTPKPSSLGVFLDGANTVTELESRITTLTRSPKRKRSASSQDSVQVSDEILTARKGWMNWQEAQCLPPSRMYVRPFARTFGTTPL